MDKNQVEQRQKILVDHVEGGPSPEGMVHVPGRSVDEPPRVRREVEIVTDPTEVAEARRVYEEEVAEFFDSALTAVESGDYLFDEHMLALNSRKRDGESALRAILHADDKPAAARASAAHTLIRMGDSSGEEFLFTSLESPNADMRRAALKMLGEWDIDVDFERDGRSKLLTSMMRDDDDSVRKEAVDLCVRKRLPGTEEQLTRLLESERLGDLRKAALDLGRVASRPESVEVMLKYLFKEKESEYSQWTGFALDRVLNHPNPSVSEPVRQALHAYTLGFEKQRHDQTLVHDLALTAGADSLPVLEDILANATDPVSKMYALGAIARLQPDSAVERILGYVQDNRASGMAVDLLSSHVKPSDAGRVIPAVVPESGEVTESVARLVLEHFVDSGRQAIESVRDRLAPSAEMWVYWKLEGIDLRTALDDLADLGIIGDEPNAVVSHMQTQRRGEGKNVLDLSEPDGLMAVLGQSSRLLAFDAETDMLPCNHHRLLLDFADAAQGALQIESPSEVWHRTSEDDFDAPYTVQFIREGKLYRFGAENFGDWYDVEAVLNAANYILASTGRDEKFIGLQSDGQVAYFIFATPETFLPFAQKYRLPLSEDAADATRKGKQFEQDVLQRLK